MTAKTRALTSRRPQFSRPINGHSRDIPLRDHTEHAHTAYFDNLNGHRPGRLYDLVMREVELPLFQAVMDYAVSLASMLRIPVSVHNVPEADVFRPSAWTAFGAHDAQGADFRACAAFGPLYGR